jgi:GTP-binding protein Era
MYLGFSRIISLLPESPAYYPKDQLTDKPERFFVNETIREKNFELQWKSICSWGIYQKNFEDEKLAFVL